MQVMKWLMNLISFDVTEPQYYVYIRPGGALDKSCIFPADESKLTAAVQESLTCLAPTMVIFSFVYVSLSDGSDTVAMDVHDFCDQYILSRVSITHV